MSQVQEFPAQASGKTSDCRLAGPQAAADGGRLAWCIVASLSLTGFMMYGGGLYAFIVLANPVAQEFHWGRASVGGLVSAFWLSAPLALWAGPLIERFGVRRLTIAGLIIEALALASVAGATELWQIYALRALAGLGKVLFAITIPVILGQWFSRRFGIALALSFAGWSLGGLLMAPLTQWLIDDAGWRTAAIIVAAAVLLAPLLPAYWAAGFYRGARSPADQSDRGRSQAAGAGSANSQPDHHLASSLKALRDNRTFTWIAGAGAVYFLTYTGLLAHQPDVITSSSISTDIASSALGTTAGIAAIGCVLIGWLADRMPVQRLSVVLIGLMLSGALLLLAATVKPSTPLLLLHIVCFGAAVGGSDVYWATAVKRSLTQDLFPVAYGIWYFISLASAVAGPMLLGFVFDATHDYFATIGFESALLLVPLFVMTVIGRRFLFPPLGADGQ